jgi:GYF domain 2
MTTYTISRDGEQFGPYSPEDLHAYIDSGHVLQTDLAWKEGMANWLPISQIYPSTVKNPAPPPRLSQPNAAAANNPAHQSALSHHNLDQYNPSFSQEVIPLPPSLHWGLVLLFAMLTFGIFAMVWVFIQQSWIKRISPETATSGTLCLIGYVVLFIVANIFQANGNLPLYLILLIASIILFLSWAFGAANAMRSYYNQSEPIGLKLSGPMVFFFNVYYLQHHMSRIANWKKTGYLTPQY